MKQRSTFTTIIILLLEMLAIFLVGNYLFSLIIASFVPQEMLDKSYDTIYRAATIAALAVAVICVPIISFNTVKSKRERALSARSNIGVLEKRGTALLEKANAVADKYLGHERAIQVGVAQARGGDKKIFDAKGFKGVIEAYPELKANESILKLLGQIENCENMTANAKIRYNELADGYNTSIHTFPGALVRGRSADLEYYADKDDELTDEMLGI